MEGSRWVVTVHPSSACKNDRPPAAAAPRRGTKIHSLIFGEVRPHSKGRREKRVCEQSATDAVNERTHYERNVIAKRRGGSSAVIDRRNFCIGNLMWRRRRFLRLNNLNSTSNGGQTFWNLSSEV